MKNILIFGATSAIAFESAKIFAAKGYKIGLAARDKNKLDSISNDIKTRFPNVELNSYIFDAVDYHAHKNIFEKSVREMSGIDIVLIAQGELPDHDRIKNDFEDIKKDFEINALSVFSISTIAAEYFENRNHGTIAVISSVAGDRGRQSNYIYGASKGAVSIFLQGLRNRLYKSGVNVITIKPGFVDTPMTAHLPKNFLFAKPSDIAHGIVNAIEKNKDIVYLPFFWKYIMIIIKLIPESIFKRLSL